jgi:acetyltransferase-like isoleucine patch superfamily enzyme
MSAINIHFGINAFDRLLAMGLKVTTLNGQFALQDGSRLEPPLAIFATIAAGSLIDIGAYTSISGGDIGNVRMGRYCAIANGVVIGANEHPLDWLTVSRIPYYPQVHDWDRHHDHENWQELRKQAIAFPASAKITTIGNDVWIGQGAFIKSGITIGDGAIIGARSVVVHDVPPYAVVVGQPARVKKLRFDEATVARLLKVQWWRYSLYDFFGARFDRIHEALDTIDAAIDSGKVQEYRPEPITAAQLQSLFTS